MLDKDNSIVWKRNIQKHFQTLSTNNFWIKKLQRTKSIEHLLGLQKKLNDIECREESQNHRKKHIAHFFQIFSFFLLKKIVKKFRRGYGIYVRKPFTNPCFGGNQKLTHDLKPQCMEKNLRTESFFNFPENLWNKYSTLPWKKNDLFDLQPKSDRKTEILDENVFYDRFNSILFQNSIKGFTPAVYDLVLEMTLEYAKKIILDLRKIAISRQKTEKKKLKEWGRNGIFFSTKNDVEIQKKIRDHEMADRIIHSEILTFKTKRKLRNQLNDERQSPGVLPPIFSPSLSSFPKKKKKKKEEEKLSKIEQMEENITRTNKTLMIFLKSILKRRIRILREATKCLCRYHPLYPKVKSRQKRRGKGFEGNKTDNFFRRRIVPVFSRYTNYITPEDCLMYLQMNKTKECSPFFLKWFFLVASDNNFRMFDNFM
jgi:hypothetical protein